MSPLGIWYQDYLLLLAHIRLAEQQRQKPDYHKLFEAFLETFDPQTRFDYGAFYTPPELASFSVRLTQALVETELKGFSLYEPHNKLFDPCCGTGNFLEQLLAHSDRAHLPKIVGFEILPAPYALAHYRITMLRGEQPHPPPNVSIVLADTLSDALEDQVTDGDTHDLLQEERAAARQLSWFPNQECSAPRS
ncbi:MAG: N-6 DNA methylase [Thermoplasmata archaeon]